MTQYLNDHKMSAKVSVIIPIYRVEEYISRCVKSLMSQTLQDVEFIFVDDATPDSSMERLNDVLALFPNKRPFIKIIRHEKNKGLPAARNSGMAIANGDYIYHCDSDDYLEADALQEMYECAVKNNADIVWCDYYMTYPETERYFHQPSYDSPEAACKGMLSGCMKYNVWNKLVRQSLYNDHNVTFPSGYSMGEDLTMIKLFTFANSVSNVSKASYHYEQGNANAMSHVYTNEKLKALKHNTYDIVDFMIAQYGNKWNLQLYSFTLLMKWPFLVTGDILMYKVWKEWFPEANNYIWQDSSVSLRIRLVEWLASKGLFVFVWLHYWIVIRIFYRIKYR